MKNLKRNSLILLTVLYLLALTILLTIAIRQTITLTRLYSAARTATVPTLATLPGDLTITVLITLILIAITYKWPRHLWKLSLLSVLLFFTLNLYSGRHLLPKLFIPPTPATLAQQYLTAVTAADLPAALALTDQSEVCLHNVEQLFQKHQMILPQSVSSSSSSLSLQALEVNHTATTYNPATANRSTFFLPVSIQQTTLQATLSNHQTLWLNLATSYRPYSGGRYLCGESPSQLIPATN